MKAVLLIDVAPTLRNYIGKKLHDAGVLVLHTEEVATAFEFMQKSPVSLILVDYTTSCEALFNFFEHKHKNLETAKIPSLVLASSVKKNEIAVLASYGVKKIIAKPVRIDELLSSIGFTLDINFQVDRTPCILETHVNEDIIFIEIAQGLNRDKLELLQFRIIDLIELYKLPSPKILVIMTDLKLTYNDISNVEYLIDTILSVKSIALEHIKFLTLNTLITEFFDGNPRYKGISVVSSLKEALSSFLSEDSFLKINSAEKLVQNGNDQAQKMPILETRFKLETQKTLSVAVVDDDLLIRKTMNAIFSEINADISLFENGEDFLRGFSDDKYDIVFLDMIMPGLNGIEVLMNIKKENYKTPFIILSSVGQREPIIKALEKGAKRYILKPVKKETVLRKTEEVLGAYI